MKRRRMQRWVPAMGMALIIGASIAVSAPPEVGAATPCCTITAFEAKTGVVTAKNTATGETIEFRLLDAAQIKSIKIGDPVSADTQTREVTVHSFQPVGGNLMKKPMPRPPKR